MNISRIISEGISVFSSLSKIYEDDDFPNLCRYYGTPRADGAYNLKGTLFKQTV